MMRRVIRRRTRSAVHIQADRAGARFAPLIPTLEKFVRLYGWSIALDLPSESWKEPRCILSWRTPPGVDCFLYLTGGPGSFGVDALCWGTQRLAGKRSWKSNAFNAAAALSDIVHEAREWALTLEAE